MTHPEPLDLTHLGQHTDDALTRAATLADRLRIDPPTSSGDVLMAWNDVSIALSNASAASSVMSEVHPDANVRGQFEQRHQAAREMATELGLDSKLFAIFDALGDEGLDEPQRRLLAKTRQDFRRAGVDKDAATQDRLRAIASEQVRIGQEFAKNIREGTRTVQVSPARLAGMPQDWLDAHQAGADGKVTLTTDSPDLVPVRMLCRDGELRHDLLSEAWNVAWPANDALLRHLFTLRAEQSRLLGYDTWANYDAEVKMIGSGPAIIEFIDKIAALARDRAENDKQALLDRLQQDRPDSTDVTAADQTYYTELVRQERFAVSAAQTRQYFDFTAVRDGLLAVTSRLFGLTWVPATAQAWHGDVTPYDVMFDGKRIGRIYLDLHPRDGKFKHAAEFELANGIRDHQLPEGVLVCNFPRGLMQHSDVTTLFHEFGHLVHHILGGDQAWSRFSGIATEWDFVEAPSQMFEEWAWDPDVLATFAKNSAGEAIPAELVAKMRAAKEVGKGADACTQMFYAALSYTVHTREYDPTEAGASALTQTVQELQSVYSVFPYLDGTHFQCSFGHLEGYSSAYYTYMWSLVIAKDLFSAFNSEDLFNQEIAHRYRDQILRPGGSKDAADLVGDFLGRPYTFDAYADWLKRS